MKKILLINTFALFGLGFHANSQTSVSTAMTPQQLVENILIGSGVTVSNITFSGEATQRGSFNGVGSNIGFASGVVLSSGGVASLPGSSFNDPSGPSEQFDNAGDASLLQVAQSVSSNPDADLIEETKDAAILEFDFVASSNSVNFNFVFGSDEYTTFINSQFNDAFGFFISGPGITGPFASPAAFPGGAKNLAVVPGTTIPITISTIHPGLNSAFYVDNDGGNGSSLNGFTTPIPVSFNVECGQTYHFKFAVTDCQDDYLNTAVFLEAGSFTSPPVDLSITTAGGNNTVREGCLDANVIFARNACQSNDSIWIAYQVTGSALEGTDYDALTNPILMVPGQDTAIINIHPLVDGVTEGTEYIVITLTMLNEDGEEVTVTGTLAVQDAIPLSVAPNDVTSKCLTDTITMQAIISGGVGVVSYDWSNGPVTNTSTTTVPANGIYYYTVVISDQCGSSITDTVKVTMNQTLAIDTIYLFPPTACNPDGAVSGHAVGITGQPQYHWEGAGGNPFIDATVMQNLSAGEYYFSVTDDVCTAYDTATLVPVDPPMAQFTASVTSGCDPLNVTFTNNSQNANTYAWDFGNGQTANPGDLSSQSTTYVMFGGTARLIVSMDGECPDTATVVITISTCGCTDPTALNYNPAATVSNGSCVYPVPTVEAPNVFTPDGDGLNEFFELKVTNSDKITLTITNRWGNVMYEQTGAVPKWDGKNQKGIPAEEGVYFYIYQAEGLTQTIEGHGFVQLFRK